MENQYVKLNTEGYGGMLCAPWMDRPLSVAGRIAIKEEGKIVTRLVNIDRDLVMIPNLAIHMNRKLIMVISTILRKTFSLCLGKLLQRENSKKILADRRGKGRGDPGT